MSRCCGALLQVLPQSWVSRVYIAPLHAARHKGAIGVFDIFICEFMRSFGVGGLLFLHSFYRLVGLGSFCIVGDEMVVFLAQIVADNDADIFEFKALRRMDAPSLVY